MGSAIARTESQTDIFEKAAAYGIEAERVDGMDVVAMEAAARRAIGRIRETGRPHFFECATYRFRAHSMFDAQLYRDKDEVAEWRGKGPIVRFQGWLLENGLIHQSDVDEIETRVAAEIAEAVDAAEAGAWEPVDTLTHHVLGPQPEPPTPAEPSGKMVETTYREAVKQAIRDAMERDDRVFLMGEDVGAYGGCYAVSKGLMDQFGEGPHPRHRRSASRASPARASVLRRPGLRPIVELMTVNFSLLALDQIMNTAATIRHMSGGQFGVPLVIRMATGAGKQLAAQHSHSLEGWYAHIPGLKVLAPATLEDARGMLWTALQDPDPVLIFENVMLYNMSGQIDETAGPVDITKAAVRREGKDLSLITYGGSLFKTLEGGRGTGEGRDRGRGDRPAHAAPLDDETILASVGKDAARGDRGRGLAHGLAFRRDHGAESWRAGSGRLTAPCPASAPRRCRSPTPRIWNRRRSRRWTGSSPPPARRWAAEMGVFVMPSLGADMEVGKLVEWLGETPR